MISAEMLRVIFLQNWRGGNGKGLYLPPNFSLSLTLYR